MTGPVATFLAALRRRLRRTWAFATFQWIAPVVGASALALVVTGRRLPEAWPEPTAAAVVVAAVLAVAVTSFVLRITDSTVARAADRQLATKDALATALEVPADGDWGERVHRRAATLIAGVPVRRAAPFRGSTRRLGLSGALLGGAMVLAILPNPQDDVRRQREADRAAIEAAADDLRDEADALAEDPAATEADKAAAEELRELADELGDTESLEEALATLDKGRAELNEGVDGDLLAQKTAVQGLDRSLEAQPLPGAEGASAADQLDQAAEGLDELDEAATADLAERIDDLAEAQSLGNPEAARALADAAAALREGDVAGARAALGEAAGAQRSAASAVSSQEASSSAAAAAARARDRLAASASGARSAGQGSAAGQGQGQGSGSGQGQGQGGGSGQGQGGGSPSGNVGGSSGGQGSGQGGQGQSGSGQGDPTGSGANEPTLFDPTGAGGDDINVGGSGSGQPGETVGQGNGATTSGDARTPLSRVLSRYLAQATLAVERGDLPPSLRDVIQAYFDQLSGS